MRVRLRGINSKRKKLADGSFKTYYWAWKGGPALRGKPGSPEFIASYNEAVAKKVMPLRGTLLSFSNSIRLAKIFVCWLTAHGAAISRSLRASKKHLATFHSPP